MAQQNHIIQKLIIEIGLPTREEAMAVQNKLSDHYKNLILKAIEEIFDRMVTEDDVIQIEKLEIDLGEIPTHDIDFEFPRKVKEEMEGALTQLIHEVRNSPAGSAQVNLTTSTGDSISVQAHVQRRTRSRLETLIHFLEFGVFPWAEDHKEKPSLKILLAEAMTHHPDQLRQTLQQLSDKRYIFKRLAQQIPEDQAQYLAAILGAPFSAQLHDFSAQLIKYVEAFLVQRKGKFKHAKRIAANELKQLIREETLLYFSASNGNKNFSTTTLSITEPLPRYLHFILERIFSISKIQPDSKSLKFVKGDFIAPIKNAIQQFAKLQEEMEKEVLKKKKAEKNAIEKLNSSERTAKIKLTYTDAAKKEKLTAAEEAAKASDQRKLEQLQNEKQKSAAEKTEELQIEEELPEAPEVEEGIYINNAGLVILVAYLPPFFTQLGFVKDRQFINEEAQCKAVHILQWLVFGDEGTSEMNETDLVLNKILCGLDIAAPVPISISLTAEEKEECESLLKAVIANWTIIKRSTIPSLRITFLQKEGKLKREDKDWHLFIHRDSAVEMLIDRLPWAISMLRPPWNKNMIYVEW